MKAIRFAEWLGKNHYTVINEEGGFYYWISESDEDGIQITEELFEKFKKENKTK
jgi:hypothetical protein